jgi:hypothetical protein
MKLNTNKPSAYLVYVHLGTNPSPTLIDFAVQSTENLEDSSLILITDFPENWSAFPGLVVKYNSAKQNSQELNQFKRRNREKRKIANGYWLYTFERLFSLEILKDIVENDVPIIHLESDVISYIDLEILTLLALKTNSVSVPRFNIEAGVGSFFYFPNRKNLLIFQEELKLIIHENPQIDNDMNLLGFMLNSNFVNELPSGRNNELEIVLKYQKYFLLIDGAAIGQYLFGQDPLHTNNHRISGFQNPFHPIKFSDCKWRVVNLNGREFISFMYQEENYLLVSVHVHSKEIIPVIQSDNSFWQRCIAEANGEIDRIEGSYVPDLIHSQKISIIDRFRIARKKGFTKTLIKKLSRLV